MKQPSDCRKRTHRKVNTKKFKLISKEYYIITNELFHLCSFCHKCQKPVFYTLCLSSCVSIRTRFGCVFLRHCIVKILANASALAPFLPRIVAKTQHRKFFEPKQDKIDCFSRRQVAGILTYFKTDNVEIRIFYLILASSDTDATA